MSRRGKQFAYGSVYLVFVASFLFVVYFAAFRSGPSCDNGRRDPREEGVDCGGVCAQVCLTPQTRSLEVRDAVKVFRPSENTIELLGRVQNANTDLAARSFSYRFDVLSPSGTVIDSIIGTSFLYAGEVRYLVAIKTNVSYDVGSVELVLGEPTFVRASEFERPMLGAIQDERFTLTSSTVSVSGRVVNNDVSVLPSVTVTTLFYNALGVIAGVSQTEVNALSPGESRPFTVLHPALEAIDIVRAELIVNALRP